MTLPRFQCGCLWPLLALTASLLAGGALLWPPDGARAAADPLLILEPDHGPCDASAPGVRMRGVDFPADRTLILFVRRVAPFSDQASQGATATTTADGAFTGDLRLYMCDPEDIEGARFLVTAHEFDRRNFGPPLASAHFTKSASPAALPGPPNTGGGGDGSPPVRSMALVLVATLALLTGIVVLRRHIVR